MSVLVRGLKFNENPTISARTPGKWVNPYTTDFQDMQLKLNATTKKNASSAIRSITIC